MREKEGERECVSKRLNVCESVSLNERERKREMFCRFHFSAEMFSSVLQISFNCSLLGQSEKDKKEND